MTHRSGSRQPPNKGKRSAVANKPVPIELKTTRLRSSGRSLANVQSSVVPAVDVVTWCDSWGSFGLHRGTTQPTISYVPANSLLGGLVNVTFSNAPSGMTTGTGQLQDGRPVQGRQGFTSSSGKGQFVDALLSEAGINPNRVNLHEYGCGGTTALPDIETTGSLSSGVPTTISSLGGTYGCPTTTLGVNGWKATDTKTGWLQKQEWLQQPGFESHPWRNYTLCDMVAYPPTGRVIVVVTLGGNDIMAKTKESLLVDPYTGAFDPTGDIARRADEVATLTGGGAMRQISAAIYLLNPNAEIWWISYTNMPFDSDVVTNTRPKMAGHFNTIGSDACNSWGRDGWKVYSGDGSNSSTDYQSPYTDPSTMSLCDYPAGNNGVSFPATWNKNSKGFFRAYGAWGPFIRNRDMTYAFLRDWWSQWIADTNAWQAQGTCANPGVFSPYQFFPYAPSSYNWRWRYSDGYSDAQGWQYSIRGGTSFVGRGWDQQYSRSTQLLSDAGTINNTIVLTAGGYINAHQLLTIVTKDVTTQNVGKVFKGLLKPRMTAAETYWRAQGKKFRVFHMWDTDGEVHPDANSQDNKLEYPSLSQDDFVEGIHLSSSGNPKWCKLIIKEMIRQPNAFDFV